MTLRVLALFLGAIVVIGAGAQARSRSGAESDQTQERFQKLTTPLKMLWIDNESDPLALSTRSAVAGLLDRAKETGFKVVVPDARNYFGLAFYDSKIADRPARLQGQDYPGNFDFLRAVAEEARARGLKTHAGLNIFTEGGKAQHGRIGAGYKHPEWLSVVYDCLARVQVGDKVTTWAAAVDELSAPGLSVFTSRYGGTLARQYSPANTIDGVQGKAASRWLSSETSSSRWVELALAKPAEVTTVVLTFPRGYPAREMMINSEASTATVSNNQALQVRVPLNGVSTRTIRIDITDTGNDSLARLEEVEVLDATGRNLARTATVRAGSFRTPPEQAAVTIVGDRVTTVATGAWMSVAIPGDGFVVVGSPADLRGIDVGTSASVTSERVLLREDEYPGGQLLYVNPANPEVRKRCLDIIAEVLTNYPVDGVVLDRARYDSLKTDFSDVSRRAFEASIGKTVTNWPADICTPADPLTGAAMAKGPLFDQWVTWRAQVIRSFFAEARKVVDRFPGKILGDYVGGWYSTYWEVGVNWAADTYKPTGDWVPAGYEKTGYAQMLDYLSPGLYYTAVGLGSGPDPEQTIDGGIDLAARVTAGRVALAPGLYLPNLNSEASCREAVSLCVKKTGGVMIFSQISLEKLERWATVGSGLQTNTQLPE